MSSGSDHAPRLGKGKQKDLDTNIDKVQARSRGDSPEASPHTQQPRKEEGKGRKGKTAAKYTRKPEEEQSILDAGDEELVRAVDRINTNKELTRGLLFLVAQKVLEARKMILSAYVDTTILPSKGIPTNPPTATRTCRRSAKTLFTTFIRSTAN